MSMKFITWVFLASFSIWAWVMLLAPSAFSAVFLALSTTGLVICLSRLSKEPDDE